MTAYSKSSRDKSDFKSHEPALFVVWSIFFFKSLHTSTSRVFVLFTTPQNAFRHFNELHKLLRCCFYFCFSQQNHILSHWPAAWNQKLPWGQFHSQRHPDALLWATVNVDQSFCYENNNNNNKKELMVGNDVPPDVMLSYISQRQYFALTAVSTSRWIAEKVVVCCPCHNDFWEILLKSCCLVHQ